MASDTLEIVGNYYKHFDGWAYYFALTDSEPATIILMACPWCIDGTIEFDNELAVEDFIEPLSKNRLAFVIHALFNANKGGE